MSELIRLRTDGGVHPVGDLLQERAHPDEILDVFTVEAGLAEFAQRQVQEFGCL